MSETQFVSGLYAKAKHEKAPSFIICKLSAKREELIKFLQEKEEEWVNMEIKEGRKGLYVAIDSWKPNQNKEEKEIQEQDKAQEEVNNMQKDESEPIDGIEF